MKDDVDARQVDPEIPRERQDDLQAFDRVRVVQRVFPFGARRAEQTFALIEAEGLRVNPESPEMTPIRENTGAAAAHRSLLGSTGMAWLRFDFSHDPEALWPSAAPDRRWIHCGGTANSREKLP